MSVGALLELSDGLLELNGLPVLRVVECAVDLHEESIVLAPALDEPERWPVPTVRWLEIRAQVLASPPLQGLSVIGTECTGQLALGTQVLQISSARLIGYRCELDSAGGRESLTLRCSAWTLEGGT